jgi:hypothetical protein
MLLWLVFCDRITSLENGGQSISNKNYVSNFLNKTAGSGSPDE